MGNKKNRNKGRIPNPPRPAGGNPRQFTVTPQQMGRAPAWNPNNKVLRDLGLHQEGGVMRLLSAMVAKFDLTGEGVVFTEADFQRTVDVMVHEGRSQLQVIGQPHGMILKLVNEATARAVVTTDNALARQTGRPQSPDPAQPGPVTPPEA